MVQITVDEYGYISCLSVGGILPGGIEISPRAVENIDMELIACYRWVDGEAVLDEEKAAIELEKQSNPPPTPEERIAELETALNLLLKGANT